MHLVVVVVVVVVVGVDAASQTNTHTHAVVVQSEGAMTGLLAKSSDSSRACSTESLTSWRGAGGVDGQLPRVVGWM